jgi:hypothetical protein
MSVSDGGLSLPLLAALLLAATMTGELVAQGTPPILRYDPPANWYRSASPNPEQYSSNEVNAGIQVYPFRPIARNIEQLMQRDLLRGWIDPQFQESNLVGPPAWGRSTVPGAEVVYSIHFGENVAGIVHEHVRLVIVARGAAAIVDASAGAPESWRRASPAMEAMYRTLRVEPAVASPPPQMTSVGPAGKEIAGLYMGSRTRYMADLAAGSAYGRTVAALHFYLFSAEGSVYRFYDVPSGDLNHFDFARAAHDDPENSGRYTIDHGALALLMGGPRPQRLAVPLPRDGRLEIEGIVYLRQ